MVKSLSIYRGQGKTGIGEGPGRAVGHGEQYLAADQPFDQDSELLKTLRPWMTLLARAADQKQLGDRLEGWSVFPLQGFQWVVRLGPAPDYESFDRRAAYFSHARAWRLDSCVGRFDPGAYLGQSNAFEDPWAHAGKSKPFDPDAPAPVRPERVRAEGQVAQQLLAWLYQAVVFEQSLVMAVPLEEFAAGSALHALVSFARAALPLHLKQQCRIRVYTTAPYSFLRELNTHLLVVPEDCAVDALQIRRDAVLIDRQGQRKTGNELAPEALGYAKEVFGRFQKLADPLLAFSDRVSPTLPRKALPSASDSKLAMVVYNIAAAIDSPTTLGDLFSQFLVPQALKSEPLPWSDLLRNDEWLALPDATLVDILTKVELTTPSGQRLVDVLANQAAIRLLKLDSAVAAWTADPSEPRLARMVYLLQRGLISAATMAAFSAKLPLEQIAARHDREMLLRCELTAGTLRARQSESTQLAALVGTEDVFPVIEEGVQTRQLGLEWLGLELYQQNHRGLERIALLAFPFAASSDEAAALLDDVIERLRAGPVSETLSRMAVELISRTPVVPTKRFINIVNLTGRPEHYEAAVRRIWEHSAVIHQSEDRRAIIRFLGDKLPLFSSRSHALLRHHDGRLRVPETWHSDVAQMMLAEQGIAPLLSAAELLYFRQKVSPPEAGADQQCLEQLNSHMRAADRRKVAVAALLGTDLWRWWRSHTALPGEVLRLVARDVIMALPKQDHTVQHWEIWSDAIEDLKLGLDDNDFAELASSWPAIRPFAGRQFEQLAAVARTPSGLLTLVRQIPAANAQGRTKDELASLAFSSSPRVQQQVTNRGFFELARVHLGIADRGGVVSITDLRSIQDFASQEGLRQALAEKFAHLLSNEPGPTLELAKQVQLGCVSQFAATLQNWLETTPFSGVRPHLDLVADCLLAVPRANAPRPNQKLANSIRSLGPRYAGVANFIAGEAGRTPVQPPPPVLVVPATPERSAAIEKAFDALRRSDASKESWRELVLQAEERKAFVFAQHPLNLIAQHVQDALSASDDTPPWAAAGVKTICSAACEFKLLSDHYDRKGLPIFELGLVLHPNMTRDAVARSLVHAMVEVGPSSQLQSQEWWLSLILSADRPRSLSLYQQRSNHDQFLSRLEELLLRRGSQLNEASQQALRKARNQFWTSAKKTASA